MRNIVTLLLLLGIFALGAAERFQGFENDAAAPMDAAGQPEAETSSGRDAAAAELSTQQTAAGGAAPEDITASEATPNESNTPPSETSEVPVPWHEAEAFIQQLEQHPQVLDGSDVEKYNAFISEAGRITRGLPPEFRQKFKDQLFGIIDKNSELPPLPEEPFEFER